MLRLLDAPTAAIPEGNTCTKPGPCASANVTFNKTATTPDVGTPPRPSNGNVTVPPGGAAPEYPKPIRLSSTRVGGNGTNFEVAGNAAVGVEEPPTATSNETTMADSTPTTTWCRPGLTTEWTPSLRPRRCRYHTVHQIMPQKPLSVYHVHSSPKHRRRWSLNSCVRVTPLGGGARRRVGA